MRSWLPWNEAVAAYAALIEYRPSRRVVVLALQFALPAPSRFEVHRSVAVVMSGKATAPLGVPLPLETVAVKVTVPPRAAGLASLVKVSDVADARTSPATMLPPLTQRNTAQSVHS